MTRSGIRQSGFLLLEVVVAIGLLVFGMALLGSRLQRSQALTYETDELARVVFLAESKLAELDTGLITPEQDIRSDFGKLFPRYGWRMRITPTSGTAGSLVSAVQGGSPADLGMFFIEMEVLFDPTRDPEQEFDFDNARVMQRYYTLRAPPRSLDLSADFGLEDDLAEQMNEDLANAGVNGLDVHDFDPSVFRDMDLEQLKEVLPIFMQAFGVSAGQFIDMLPEEMRGTVQAWLDSLPDDAGDGSGDGGAGEGGSGGGNGGQGGAGGNADGVSGGEPGEGGRRAGRGGQDVGRRGGRPGRGADGAGDNGGGEGGIDGGANRGGRGGDDMDQGGANDGAGDEPPRRGGRRGPRDNAGGGGGVR